MLDIGCGWGGLLLHAVEHYGVRAVGITLSDDQHAYVSQQGEARGLAGRVEVQRMDYRDLPDTAATTRSPASACSSTSDRETSTPISARLLRC